ncbi:MAG: isoleucine--tRNA ligase [Planctomycetia bacterium]|nr:isoleucine--tRNA ligase [Planctomycetia bacterium]
MDASASTGADFPGNEVRLIKHWRENHTWEQALENRRANNIGTFVFYEGPPTANGLPHPGHCLTRAIKDLYPRYKSMKGFLCERKAGWDTHGLPVEVEVCKEMKIHSKEQIEEFGIEPFVHRCVENVFRYIQQWEDLTERIGFWINLDEAYVTYHRSYVESVWWALKTLFDQNLLYQGHKIVWWWAQGGTALSSGEVGQGYKQVADPSVFVRFPLLNDQNDPRFEKTDLLVWTTTPWTLPSNQFAAVHPDLEYSVVELFDPKSKEPVPGNYLIIASALVKTIAAKVKKEAKVLFVISGKDLIGLRYTPPFDYYYKNFGSKKGTLKDGTEEYIAWRVCSADFVTTEAGTGLVHEAPAFGEVDFDLLIEQQARYQAGEGPELICAVAPNGTFTDIVPEFQGRWVKECDKEIIQNLKHRGILFLQEQYLHDYPFCWRASSDPLIQYPRKSWFIRTRNFREKMLENNEKIEWMPEHIKNGRFGNFLASNVDWALSRERYWGTPLPIWVCEETGYQEAIGSFEELLAKKDLQGTEVWTTAYDKAKAEAGAKWTESEEKIWQHLRVHKPYIDAITYESPKAPGKRMRRVPEVIDCWFDSGSMPFAQFGYPHQKGSKELFEKNFPADFISEAIDQTRGWFYSQLAISTLLFADKKEFPHPFKNCIVLGLMLGEDGQKMSKSLRNYREPREIFDKYGADALRWYFYANQTPWTSIRYSETAIRDSMPEFMIRLWNVCTFFDVYRKIDGFAPEKLVDLNVLAAEGGNLSSKELRSAEKSSSPYRPIAQRTELDRWILSELHQTIETVSDRMDHYDHFAACSRLTAFVDSLSNWYVRRSRDRFWSGANLEDASEQDRSAKADAYWTLYECLITLARLIAPFVPFLAERIWLQLAVEPFGKNVRQSVHFCTYPVAEPSEIDRKLSYQMEIVREIVSLGRNARMGAKLKVRQPLQAISVVLADPAVKDDLIPKIELMKEELNVKEIHFIEKADQYISYSVLPDFKKLGPKLGKRLPAVKGALANADGAPLLNEMNQNGKIVLALDGENVELGPDEVQIRLQPKEGFAAAQGSNAVVVLSTELSEELRAEGRAREIVRIIQDRRKDLNCEYTDRIIVKIKTDSASVLRSMNLFAEYIKGETLALELDEGAIDGIDPVDAKIDAEALSLFLKIVK